MFLVVFTEVQRFSSFWLFLLLAIVIIVLIRAFVAIAIAKDSRKVKWLLVPVFLIPIVIIALTLFMRLETRMDATGIYYRFYPITMVAHKIEWPTIDSAYVRTYSPVAEYGGWGIRGGHNGRAYNAAGNQGLQLVFKDGTRLLLGTQKPKEIMNALTELKKSGITYNTKDHAQ